MTSPAQIIVVGGGPAGLVAAATAARVGASVMLVDEGVEPGGQLLYRGQPITATPGAAALRPGELRDALLGEANAAGVDLRANTLAAGIYANGEVLIVEPHQTWSAVPAAVILAAGSTDLPFPFTGGTLPGVFSCRAVQILINRWGLLPGARCAVIGAGAEAEELAIDILLAGGEVVWGGIAPAQVLRSTGKDGIDQLHVGPETYDVDIVGVAVGRQPDLELAAMSGATIGFAAALGGLVPLVDAALRIPGTSTFVCGDGAGTGSVAAVLAEGKLAGLAAAASLGLCSDGDVAEARSAGSELLNWRIVAREAVTPTHLQPYQ